MFPVCGEGRGTTTTPVVVLVVVPVDSHSSDFEKFLRNFQNCEDGSTCSTPRKKVEEYLVVFSGSEDTLIARRDERVGPVRSHMFYVSKNASNEKKLGLNHNGWPGHEKCPG
jgi:hypothetical protein